MAKAIVTGGSSGLGVAIIRDLSALGMDIVAISRRQPELHNNVCWLKTDLSNLKEVNALCSTLKKEIGKIDLLINNAAISPASRIINLKEAEFDEVSTVNFLAPRMLIRALSNNLADGGTVINIVSRVALEGRIGLAAYGIAKAMLLDYTTLNANLFAAQGTTIFAVNPGYMATGMATEKATEIQKKESLFGTIATADRASKLILKLWKQNFVHGTFINLDSRMYNRWMN